MTVVCCKDICPHSRRKARCIGCIRTMFCKERDPTLPRVFPKIRKDAIVLKITPNVGCLTIEQMEKIKSIINNKLE